MRHRRPDRKATAARNFADKRSFVDIHGLQFLRGADMAARRKEVYERDKGHCQLDGTEFMSSRCWGAVGYTFGEVDHIKSRGLGGSDDLANLRWCCSSCHRKRHMQVKLGTVRKS